jgi:hypothetical protein
MHHTRRHTDGDSVIRDILENDRIRADDRTAPDANARSNDHVLSEPRAVPDLDRRRTRYPLLENRPRAIVVHMAVVGDVRISPDPNRVTDSNRGRSRNHGPGHDDRVVADHERGGPVLVAEHLQPAALRDKDPASQGHPVLAGQVDWRLEDGVFSERCESSRRAQ